MDNVNNLDLSGSVCRACLKLGAKNKIFSVHKPSSLQCSYVFYSCLSIQPELGDGLPENICRNCLNKLINFYKFKITVTQNDSKLREVLKCKQDDKTLIPELNEDESKAKQQFGIIKSPVVENNDIPNVKGELKQEDVDDTENKSQSCFGEDSVDIFEDYDKFETQKAKIRGSRRKNTHQCDICGKILSCKGNLNQHIRKHTGERPYACDVCGKRFFKAEHVTMHKRTHTGERPHQCTICPKKFIQYAALKVHLRTHSGERPHMCSVCGKSFSQSSSLVYHMRTHSQETPFACKLCGKGFKNAGNLNIHKRFHDNERPFSCKICDRRFFTSSHLKVHVKQHNGIKSHQCIVCGKAFVRSEHLKGHLIIHTGQKPHACSLCPKKYTQKSHLNRHMKSHKM